MGPRDKGRAMCGIAGVAGPAPADTLARRVRAAGAAQRHRGPDDEGVWAAAGFAFGMTRLSIIDLAGGHQPMFTPDGMGIVFNGEIYNYREIRADLEARGERFDTKSDTEVVLRLIRRDGWDALARLEGMFAFALHDPREKRLHLVRDRFGVKPLYYSRRDGHFYFASELKGLLAMADRRPSVDPQALHDYLTLRYVPSPRTVWEGVFALGPGDRLTFPLDGGEPAVVPYYRYRVRADAGGESPDAVKEFNDLFLGAVSSRLLASDVPVGLLLSGGLDSSAVAAAAAALGHRNFHTFSVGFDGTPGFDETDHARAVAAHVGARHHEVRVTAAQCLDFLPTYVRQTDQPLADLAGLPLSFVCRLARTEVKVVLSGEGADEILAGYHLDALDRRLARGRAIERFLPSGLRAVAARWPGHGALARRARAWGRGGVARLVDELPVHMTLHWTEEEKARLWRAPFAPASTEDAIRSWYAAAPSDNPLERVQQVLCGSWLADDLLMKADKVSMAASLELREPFLDRSLAEWAAALPVSWKVGNAAVGRTTKRVLREWARTVLPPAIAERPKRGFPVPFYGAFSENTARWADDALFGPGNRWGRWFDTAAARPVWSRAQRGDTAAAHKIWVLLVLELWFREWT